MKKVEHSGREVEVDLNGMRELLGQLCGSLL